MSQDPNATDTDTLKGLSLAIAGMAGLTLILILAANISFGA